MFENPRRGRLARNFAKNVQKILDLKSSPEQIFSENCRWVPLIAFSRLSNCNFLGDQIVAIDLELISTQLTNNNKWPFQEGRILMAASVLSRWSTQVNKLTDNKKKKRWGGGREYQGIYTVKRLAVRQWPDPHKNLTPLHQKDRWNWYPRSIAAHATFDRWYFSCLPSERLPLVVIKSCDMSNAGIVRTKSKQLARAATQICCQIIPNSTSQSTINPDGQRQASKRRGSSKWLSQEKAFKPTFFLETTTKRWNLNQFRVLPFDSSLQSQQNWWFN